MGINNTTRLGIDVGLFLALLVAFFPASTGISVHEWLSLAIVIPSLFHLIINWDWVTRTATRLFGKLRTISRANLAVDTVLFISTVTVMLSGFMVSQTIASALDVVVVPSVTWHVVHSLSADLVIAAMLLHLVLHWRWLVRVVDGLLSGTSSQPVPATNPVSTHSASPERRNHVLASTSQHRSGPGHHALHDHRHLRHRLHGGHPLVDRRNG